MDTNLIKKASAIVDYLALYHRHRVVGMEHVPTKGGCLIVCNHSLATYDILILNNYIYKKTKRLPRALMDRWFFKYKPVSDWTASMGGVQGDQQVAHQLLTEGNLVVVAPGGMREAIRSSEEKYQIIWNRRKGFARLAINAQTPVLLAACPKADDIFDVLPTGFLSTFFYNNFKIPFAIVRGFGLTPIPKPVQLVHYIAEPMYPPKLNAGEEATPKMVNQFHKQIVKRMNDLMGQALTCRADDAE